MSSKIYHVHFIEDNTDFYFGSLSAIFVVFPPDKLRVSLNQLKEWKKSRLDTQYKNNIVVIKPGNVIRKVQKDTRKKA